MFGATAGLLGLSVLLTQVNGLTAALGRFLVPVKLLSFYCCFSNHSFAETVLDLGK